MRSCFPLFLVVLVLPSAWPAQGEELRAAARVNAPLAIDDDSELSDVEHEVGGEKKWQDNPPASEAPPQIPVEMLVSKGTVREPGGEHKSKAGQAPLIEGSLRASSENVVSPTLPRSVKVALSDAENKAGSNEQQLSPAAPRGRIVGQPQPYGGATESSPPVAQVPIPVPIAVPSPAAPPLLDAPATTSPLVQEAERPLPGLPNDSMIPQLIVGGQPISPYTPPPNVLATPIPSPEDGLQGNRQVALTPFPNLYMQAGPLAAHQLPWYHQLPEEQPYTFWQTLEFNSLIGALKSNGVDNSQGGWYNSIQAGIPFWTEKQVGMQFGIGFEPNMLQTNYVRFTGGFFRRAIWPLQADIYPGLFQRLSGGTVYDGIYDSEHRAYMGQVRSQIGYAIAPQREFGGWFTMPMQGTETFVGPNAPLTIDTTTTFVFYYRQTFPSEVDATFFGGWAEGPGGMHIGTYLSYHFAQQASLICWGMFNMEAAGANAIYAGLSFHFAPHEDYTLISGNPQNRYRPFLRMADPIQLQLRKTLILPPP